MVGVGGRSKGCGTCSRRHLKCDEGRPHCQRCRTAGIPCAGYRDATFISFEAGSSGLQRLNHERLTPSNLRDQFNSETPSLVILNKPFVSWPPDDLCIAYARVHLPSFWDEDASWRIRYPADSSLDPNVDQNLVQYTLISFARTLFACRFQQNDLLQEGFALYRQVLSAINDLLGRSECLLRLDLFESIIALRTYDSFMRFHKDAWIQHSMGLEKLLEIRGPGRHCDATSRRLLAKSRPLIIMAALAQERTTILGEQKWKTVPWADGEVSKSSQQHLMDIFADLPDIGHVRARVVEFQRLGNDTRSLDVWMVERAVSMLQDLQHWRTQWNIEHPEACFDVENCYPGDLEIAPPWTEGLGFSNASCAKEIAIYDAVCLMLLTMVFGGELGEMACMHDEQTCLDTASQIPMQSGAIVGDEYGGYLGANLHQTYHNVLLEACRSTNYYFVAAAKKDHPIDILVPLRQSWLAGQKCPCPLAMWLNDAMHKIGDSISEGIPLLWRLEEMRTSFYPV